MRRPEADCAICCVFRGGCPSSRMIRHRPATGLRFHKTISTGAHPEYAAAGRRVALGCGARRVTATRTIPIRPAILGSSGDARGQTAAEEACAVTSTQGPRLACARPCWNSEGAVLPDPSFVGEILLRRTQGCGRGSAIAMQGRSWRPGSAPTGGRTTGTLDSRSLGNGSDTPARLLYMRESSSSICFFSRGGAPLARAASSSARAWAFLPCFSRTAAWWSRKPGLAGCLLTRPR